MNKKTLFTHNKLYASIALLAAQSTFAANFNTNKVYACDTTPNDTSEFNSCFVASSQVTSAAGIVINAKNTVGYVTDFGDTTYSCPIMPSGIFAECTLTLGFQNAIGLALGY